ncbi:cyanophycin metabolism-associated ABC transporter [Tuwongella immobilis]
MESIPIASRAAVESLLIDGESILGVFLPDLNAGLQFEASFVVLTDRRLLAPLENGATNPDSSDSDLRNWRVWDVQEGYSLKASDSGGIGILEFFSPQRRLATWRYTAAKAIEAQRFAQRYDGILKTRRGELVLQGTVCPSCGAAITSDDGICQACKPKDDAPKFGALWRLSRFARTRSRQILIGFGLTLASTTAAMVPPYLTMPLLDNVLIPHQAGQPADFGLVKWYLGGLVLAAMVAWVLDWARVYVLANTSELIAADVRNATYRHLQSLSLEFFGGKRTGDLISRVSSDSDRLCNFLSINVVDFCADCLMILLTATILLRIDAALAMATLLPFPIILLLVYWIRGRLLRNFRHAGVAWSGMTSILADTIPGIRVVKAFAQESREVERFEEGNERVVRANDRVNILWSFFTPTVALMTTLGLVVVWASASYRVSQNQITVGVLTLFLAYITRFYGRIEGMIRMVNASQRAAASAQRIFEILDRIPSVPEPTKPIEPGRLNGGITLDNVRFQYGTREVIHGVSLEIQPGEMIGLVGPSGAGKSTLVNLICRFYDVAAGAIKVDGVDIRSFSVQAYRANIGIVLQEPFLFYGTIAENIAYGKPDATREQIVAAARAARAHDFILKLNGGYDSLVGERGQSLSGGERQRISIARALLMNPAILILDEATSSVDNETEREIQAALDSLIQGRTTIAIAHRLTTLRRANRLIVLERGRIVEMGNHEQLIDLPNGVYARLHQTQDEAGANAEPSAAKGGADSHG